MDLLPVTTDLHLLPWFSGYLLCFRYLPFIFRSSSEALPEERPHGNGPARYYRIEGFQGSIGFISAITGLSLILSILAVGITSLYLLFATSTDDQLLHYGSQIDQAIEMQLGQSTEEMFGTSYEDMMEQLVALRDAATGTGGQ